MYFFYSEIYANVNSSLSVQEMKPRQRPQPIT
jgi:hypothetical protein